MILTSPYLRARQTADIVRDVLAPEVPMQQVSAMVPDGDPAKMLRAISDAGCRAPICVGHAPSLDRFIAHVSGARVPFTKLKKAGMCTLAVDRLERGRGRLFALYPPSVLRGLAQ